MTTHLPGCVQLADHDPSSIDLDAIKLRCEGCECALPASTPYDVENGWLCATCAVALAELFLELHTERTRFAAQRYSETLVEPTSRGWG